MTTDKPKASTFEACRISIYYSESKCRFTVYRKYANGTKSEDTYDITEMKNICAERHNMNKKTKSYAISCDLASQVSEAYRSGKSEWREYSRMTGYTGIII